MDYYVYVKSLQWFWILTALTTGFCGATFEIIGMDGQESKSAWEIWPVPVFWKYKIRICRESFVNSSVEKVFFMNDVHKNQLFLYLRLFGCLCGLCFFSKASSQILDIKGLIKQLKNPFQPMWHSSGLSSREWESKSRQDNTKNEIAFHFGYKDKSEIFCSMVLHSCVFAYRKEEKKSKKKIILCLQKSCTKMQVLELSFSNSSNNCSHQVRRRNASIPKTILCC